jgi:phage terminase small subunit
MQDKIRKIRESLENIGAYSTSLDIQIQSLACAWDSLEKAHAEASKLKKTTIVEQGRFGKKVVPHPVYKIMRDAEMSITKQMKALGLTFADIVGETVPPEESDMTADIMASLNK